MTLRSSQLYDGGDSGHNARRYFYKHEHCLQPFPLYENLLFRVHDYSVIRKEAKRLEGYLFADPHLCNAFAIRRVFTRIQHVRVKRRPT